MQYDFFSMPKTWCTPAIITRK